LPGNIRIVESPGLCYTKIFADSTLIRVRNIRRDSGFFSIIPHFPAIAVLFFVPRTLSAIASSGLLLLFDQTKDSCFW